MDEQKLKAALIKLYQVNLGLGAGERLLVLTDTIRPGEEVNDADRERRSRLLETARLACQVGQEWGAEVNCIKYPSLGMHAVEPPEAAWQIAYGPQIINKLREQKLLEKLLNKTIAADEYMLARELVRRGAGAVEVVVALANYSTTHTRFRKLLTEAAGARYASMPLFDSEMFWGPMDVDWELLAKRTGKVAQALTEAAACRLSAPNGTDLWMSLEGREGLSDDGLLTYAGACGNLPAGEAFIAPLETGAHGNLVIEYAPTYKLDEPITFIFQDSHVVQITGKGEYANTMREHFRKDRRTACIAELGVGTNEKAVRADNILESEKILGTAHIAVGDNLSFGGTNQAPLHVDSLVFAATLELEFPGGKKEKILEGGKLRV
jgi:leucyl aminopeptidase (aminopeptidase T)